MDQTIASRLSDPENKKMDLVLNQNQSKEPPKALSSQIPVLDFASILKGPAPASTLQAQDPQIVYTTIRVRGLNDCIDVLPLLSREQFVKILDYDVWDRLDLVPSKAWVWLKAYASISSKALYARFRSLDEEYQLALLSGRIEVFQHEDGLDGIDLSIHDQLIAMPCNKVFYRILSSDLEEAEIITRIIDAAIEQDLTYAYALINEAFYAPPKEAEYQLLQFRNARISEDGFVPFEESIQFFAHISIHKDSIKQFWHSMLTEEKVSSDSASGISVRSSKNGNLLLQILSSIKSDTKQIDSDTTKSLEASIHGVRFLANGLASSVDLQADDVFGMRYLLQNAQALMSLGLDYMLRFEAISHDVRTLFLNFPAKTIFQKAYTLVDLIRNEILLDLVAIDSRFSVAKKFNNIGKHELCVEHIEKTFGEELDIEMLEFLKNLMCRFPKIASKSLDGKAVFVPMQSIDDIYTLAAQYRDLCIRLSPSSTRNIH